MVEQINHADFELRLRTAARNKFRFYYMAADACGLPHGTFEGYLHRGEFPSAASLVKISEGLGVSIDWLLKGETPSLQVAS